MCVCACVCVCFISSRKRPHLPKSWALRWVDRQFNSKKDPKGLFFADNEVPFGQWLMCYYTLQALQQLLWKPGSRHGFFVQPRSLLWRTRSVCTQHRLQMLFIEFWKASWEAEKLGTVSSLSPQARSSSGCQVKKPPHYPRRTQGCYCMVSTQCYTMTPYGNTFL